MDNSAAAPVYARSDAVAGEQAGTAVSWRAILAGAVVAAATSVVLITLGTGLGLSALRPWEHYGPSVTTFAVSTAIGLIVVQWVSAFVGGYIAGRLRTKWAALHTHEVFFRDTAHGFITWAMATLIVAAASALMTSSVFGAGVHTTASVAAGATSGAASTRGETSIDPYDVDTLLRPANPSALPATDLDPQVTHILATGLKAGSLSSADQTYLAQLVAAHTGVSPADAETRVSGAFAKVNEAKIRTQQAADAARKAARAAAIFTGLAMLIGAFIACISAALGGRLRDLHA